jgi:hypothetical protein
MHKLNSLRNMRFAEQYNRYISDKDNLAYYKLKYASQSGKKDTEREAFEYYENEQIKHNGSLSGLFNKPPEDNINRTNI